MKILINGVIANVVERRRCQWVLTNQDRSEVLRRYVLCVYYVCVCVYVSMGVCTYCSWFFPRKMSISPILTFPQLLLLFRGWKWTTLTAYGNILKIPKKCYNFQFSTSTQGLGRRVDNIGMDTTWWYWKSIKIQRRCYDFLYFSHLPLYSGAGSGQYWSQHFNGS